ncbi:MAG TPA: nucleoside deaminase [Lachnospiraceae bacterium]|nr:nucleoside deaminase [Lachnospiraceae bacterium]
MEWGKNIIIKGITTVWDDNDPTAHAEVNEIRAACKKLGVSEFPKGYYLYSTFEPCPLCTAAAIWAKIDGIVYANNPKFRGKEENWSFITSEEMLKRGEYIHHVELIKDFMIDSIKDYFVSGK